MTLTLTIQNADNNLLNAIKALLRLALILTKRLPSCRAYR